MKSQTTKILFNLFLTLFVLISCARIGSPTGGKKDIIPPQITNYSPSKNQINVPIDLNKIELNFNEFIILKKPEEIIFTPSFITPPNFKPNGVTTKKITILLKDKLEENTTYAINFVNSIVDNNEENPLPYLNFAFSTGNKIDSLEIRGKINLTFIDEKKENRNYIVGLFQVNDKFNDSIIFKSKPRHIAKVDSLNTFKLNNLKKDLYKLVVFNDLNKNSIYEEDSEDFGFFNKNINLTENNEIKIDISEFSKKYKLKELKSTGYGKLNFIFEGLTKNIKIEPIDKKINVEKLNHYSDSINYWYNPENTKIEKDIKFKVTNLDSKKIDTINCVIKKTKKPKMEITFKNNFSTINKNITLSSSTPIIEILKDNIKLLKIKNKDSILIPFQLLDDESEIKNKNIYFKNEWNTDYILKINKNAVKDIFGNSNTTTILEEIKFKQQEKLANIKLTFNNESGFPFIVQLLNEKKELIKEEYKEKTNMVFELENLIPGKYSIIIKIDENSDGIWNKANYLKNTQSEKTLFFDNIIEARAMWVIKEEVIIPPIE